MGGGGGGAAGNIARRQSSLDPEGVTGTEPDLGENRNVTLDMKDDA